MVSEVRGLGGAGGTNGVPALCPHAVQALMRSTAAPQPPKLLTWNCACTSWLCVRIHSLAANACGLFRNSSSVCSACALVAGCCAADGGENGTREILVLSCDVPGDGQRPAAAGAARALQGWQAHLELGARLLHGLAHRQQVHAAGCCCSQRLRRPRSNK